MKEKKVEQSDLIGEIKDFPIEIVQAMVDEQVRQGNKANVINFQLRPDNDVIKGGFRWSNSVEDFTFWDEVIHHKNFNLFFQKYPNKQSITIKIPDGYEIDTDNSTFTNIVFKPIENKYPNSWDDAFVDSNLNGYCIACGTVSQYFKNNASKIDTEIYKTEKQAKSALAYAQITQLMALPCYNGDWVPDWNEAITKYCIERTNKNLKKSEHCHLFIPICFKSSEVRDAFLQNNEKLLKQYFEMD